MKEGLNINMTHKNMISIINLINEVLNPTR